MSLPQPGPEILRRYRPAIINYLADCLRRWLPSQQGLLRRMIRYHLGFESSSGQPAGGPEGKLLRPTLLLFSCEAVGGKWRRALPAAGALELVHDFSLVHDDIQDQDAQRHHRPTLWSLWGVAQAINAGDALQALAGLALGDLAEQGIPASQLTEAQAILARATLKLIEGQVQDLDFEGHLELKPAGYLEMIAGKTGALFQVAFQMGALLGRAEPETIAALAAGGRHLGLAFQIRDDILGLWGAEDQTGKAGVSDLARHKLTLPLIYALERAGEAEREALLRFYRAEPETLPSATQIIQILDRLAVRQEARALMQAETERALAVWREKLPTDALFPLRELVDSLFGRFTP